MGFAEWTAAFAALATAVQLITTAIAAIRCRARTKPLPPPEGAAPVTIVRPVCGVENFARETLASSLALDYPQYRVLFCAARADDPAVPLVRELLAAHPDADAALLIGDDRAGPNPKLNNTIKGFDAATTDWIIMADSNVLMPHDYIQRLLARWRPNSGVVVSLPIGARPANFAAELECAFLNTYQARWEYVSDTLGMGFAQGKNMLFRRDILEAAGGIRALGADIAEDAATTKLVRSSGRAAHLMDAPFDQPLGPRSFRELWARQVRWARLRRITFPLLFAPELLCGCASSTGRSCSRSAAAAPPRCGTARCAGRGCGARAFSFIFSPKLWPAPCCRCLPRQSSPVPTDGRRRSLPAPSAPSGTAPRWRWPPPPNGTCRFSIRSSA